MRFARNRREPKADVEQPLPSDQEPRLLGAERSPIPLYHRLYVILRERITTGVYRPGERVPAEADLMASFGVSRITAKRALDELCAEGLVERARGRGTTVMRSGLLRQGSGEPIAARIDGLLANLSLIGQATTIELLEFDYVPAPFAVAGDLRIPAGEIIQRAVRVRTLEGRPFSHSTSHVIESIGRTFTPEEMKSTPLIDLLARAGVRIHEVRQSITATLADDITAARLAVTMGSALLKLRRVFIDERGRRIDAAEILYPPARFEYRMTLSRDSANWAQVEPHL